MALFVLCLLIAVIGLILVVLAFAGRRDDAGLPTVTMAAAMAWANAPDVDPVGTVASRRMTIARGFARHMAGIDARTEIPPFGVVGSRRHRHEPYIFSPTDIDMLLGGAQGLRTRFACATHHSMIGLLATTGMRSLTFVAQAAREARFMSRGGATSPTDWIFRARTASVSTLADWVLS